MLCVPWETDTFPERKTFLTLTSTTAWLPLSWADRTLAFIAVTTRGKHTCEVTINHILFYIPNFIETHLCLYVIVSQPVTDNVSVYNMRRFQWGVLLPYACFVLHKSATPLSFLSLQLHFPEKNIGNSPIQWTNLFQVDMNSNQIVTLRTSKLSVYKDQMSLSVYPDTVTLLLSNFPTQLLPVVRVVDPRL